jgi:hypothetical protein
MTLQDPCTSRLESRDDEWLLVLTPVNASPSTPQAAPASTGRDDES